MILWTEMTRCARECDDRHLMEKTLGLVPVWATDNLSQVTAEPTFLPGKKLKNMLYRLYVGFNWFGWFGRKIFDTRDGRKLYPPNDLLPHPAHFQCDHKMFYFLFEVISFYHGIVSALFDVMVPSKLTNCSTQSLQCIDMKHRLCTASRPFFSFSLATTKYSKISFTGDPILPVDLYDGSEVHHIHINKKAARVQDFPDNWHHKSLWIMIIHVAIDVIIEVC